MVTRTELEELFIKFGSDLVNPMNKDLMDQEFKNNYKEVLIRIRAKLQESGLPAQIGIFPLLMDFFISDEICLAYHHNYGTELSSTEPVNTCRYCNGPVMSLLNFEKFAYRLIDFLFFLQYSLNDNHC